MSYVQRPNKSLQNWGIGLSTWGTIMTVVSFALPLLEPTGTHTEGIAACRGIGIVLLVTGLLLFGAYYSFYYVPRGYVMLYGRDQSDEEGWHLGLLPASQTLVSTERRLVEVCGVEIETPDKGILEASVTVSYTPETNNPLAQRHFANSETLKKAIDHRVRSGLNKWVMGKQLPGTLKRAMSMQKEAEEYIRERIVGTSTELALYDDPVLYLESGFPVNDLGIRVYEVNLVTWRPLRDGTGKPDWGDGDHVAFDAQAIFKQFHAHTDSLSGLRKLKEALMERYPEEAEDIEDIYDQVRISMKENRDR